MAANSAVTAGRWGPARTSTATFAIPTSSAGPAIVPTPEERISVPGRAEEPLSSTSFGLKRVPDNRHLRVWLRCLDWHRDQGAGCRHGCGPRPHVLQSPARGMARAEP